jgi:hypothetical protein
MEERRRSDEMKKPIMVLGILLLFSAPGFSTTRGNSLVPPGFTDRPIEIDANGVLLVGSVTPPPGTTDRAIEIDANGVLLVGSVTPPAGLIDRAIEIDANGVLLVGSVTPPAGLIDRAIEIDANGVLLVGSVTPPPGLKDRPVEIDESGNLGSLAGVPALSAAGALLLMLLTILVGNRVLKRRLRMQSP